MATGNASAQNNVITAAEYQAAADEITAIINAQRAERAPIEAEQELLRNRQELLITRQQLALNTLRAAEADPGDTAFLEASRTAYARATGEVNATNLAIQQNRSVLAQSRQSTAELQEQRGRLEVNAEFADRGPPTQNSLPPPATVVPDQSATYVAPPAAPVLTQSQPDLQPEADIPPLAPASQNNVSTASQWFETETEITSASRSIRAENAATTQNLASLRSDYNQATQTDEALKSQIAIAQRSGASAAEIERLEERRGETLARTAELERQINRDESVLAQNQETLAQLDQQRFIAEEAQFAASSGTPGLNSVPPPATVIPDQPNTFYSPPEITYAGSFDAESVAGDGDEALQAYEEALLAQTEGRAFGQPEIPADGDEALQAYEEAVLAQQEGRAFGQPAIPSDGDEALQAFDEAVLAQTEGRAFGQPAIPASGDEALQAFEDAQFIQGEGRAFAPQNINDPYYGLTPQQIQALGNADPTDPYIRARLGIPQLPGSELVATPGFGTIKTGVPLIDNAIGFLQNLFGGPPKPAPAPVSTLADPEARAIQDAVDADLAAQEGAAFAEPVSTLDDPEARAIQDAIDADLAAQEGQAFPPIDNPAPVSGDDALQAVEDAEAAALAAQEGGGFAEPLPVDAGSDEELQAIEDAQAADLAAQEGLAFPPIDSPAPVAGDDALQALEDAEAANLAAQEGRGFLEPLDVPASGDDALQAIEDAELAAQEGLAFPPIDSPAPVAGDEALQAIEDAEAADLARQEGIAFAEPLDVPASGDEALQAIEDAELAAQEGGAFAESPLPVSGDDALAATNEAELAAIRDAEGRAILGPAPVDGDPAFGAATDAEAAAINQALADDAEISGAAALQAGREQQLRDQFTIQQRYNTSTQGDWRVRIRLAPGANYLYKAPAGQRGILEPLVASDGVIFPYTPTIQTSYQAKYDSYNLTHSNYRGYFYQGSQVGDITISGIFTAQDTTEAQYLLAVIHFFRSVTKMFYGKDQFRGAPPPSVELSGFGQYQFNNHPCLVASFNYSLPKDVDYIQIAPNNQGLNLGNRPSKVSSSPSSTLESVSRRLTNAGLPRGGQTSPTDLGVVTNTVNGTSQTTYVPTKVEIAITLHPLQTRQQVSQAFSLENFANGNLLKGGFW